MTIKEWTIESRAKQGLPPTIQDPTIITNVAILADLMPATRPQSPQDGKSGQLEDSPQL
jgi:hypothetical protein